MHMWSSSFKILVYVLHLSIFLNSKKVDLYEDFMYIHEVLDQGDFQTQIFRNKDISMVVFYAPWCPHCQHFVDPFSQFANRNQDRNITFRAVNCERLNDICRSNSHVKGYPSLVAYHIPSTAPDYQRQDPQNGLALSSSIKDLQLFVDANVPFRTGFGLPTTPLVSGKHAIVSKREDDVAEWVRIHANGAARRAGPDDRLADALTSIDYLLSHELLHNYHKTAYTSVLTLLEVLCSVLPANYNTARAKYLKLHEVFLRAGHPLSSARRLSLQQIIDALLVKKVAGIRSLPHWVVCGISGSNGRSEVTEGYTCGLWLLLHFMTVAADHRARFEQTLSRETLAGETGIRVRVPQVMAAVRALVNLFGCNDCR